MLAGPAAQGQSAHPTALNLAFGFVESYEGTIPTGFAAYPELEVSKRLVRSTDAGISLHFGLFAGGWIDKASDNVRCLQCSPWRQRTARLGWRTAARLDHALVPLRLWVGGAYHGTWRSVETPGGGRERTFYTTRLAAAAGARLEVPLTENLSLVPGAQAFLELPFDGDTPSPWRLAWTLGLSHSMDR